MSATTRTVQAIPASGRLLAIFLAALVATALFVALAYTLMATTVEITGPGAAAAPIVVHNHREAEGPAVVTPAQGGGSLRSNYGR